MTGTDRTGLPPVPPEVRREMAEIGPVWGRDIGAHIARITELFTEILARMPARGVRCTAPDAAYGRHERHRLDVYRHAAQTAPAPALLFVHGGAFVRGSRNKTDQIYSNVARFFAAEGMVGVNIGYRLADAAPYPGATQDIAAAVAWVKANADEHGIDPDRLFLMGHSAGGAHAATYAYDSRFQPAGGHGLAGLLLVSGRVRAETLPDNPNREKVVAYYGPDPELHEAVSAVNHVTAGTLPTFLAWAEFENPLIDMHMAELGFALARAKRRSPPQVWLRGHNHTSAVAHIGTDDTRLADEILAFVADPR